MREFSAILGSCVVSRIAQSFFTSEQQCLEVDSVVVGVVLDARAFAAAVALLQLAALWSRALQNRHKFLSRRCCQIGRASCRERVYLAV